MDSLNMEVFSGSSDSTVKVECRKYLYNGSKIHALYNSWLNTSIVLCLLASRSFNSHIAHTGQHLLSIDILATDSISHTYIMWFHACLFC